MSANRLLVPVSDSSTIRQTVEYAVKTALEEGPGHVRFVYLSPREYDHDIPSGAEHVRDFESAETLLDRVAVWARQDAGDHAEELTVETGFVGEDQFLFSPEDVAKTLLTEATRQGIEHIIIDPEYDPGIGSPLVRPLEFELAQLGSATIEEAPVRRQTRRMPLLVGSSPVQIGAIFGVAFIFYQLLAGSINTFDLVTGVISATIVAVGLRRVTFNQDPNRRSLVRLGRLGIYTPYLLWEILKSNVLVAAVILHPRLPIEPRLTRIRPAVWGGLPITTLANSITLTPGTLSVRVEENHLIVHTLVPEAREDLFAGGLERAVRFVFYGRKAMSIPTPKERGDTEILDSARRKNPADEAVVQEMDEIKSGENTAEPQDYDDSTDGVDDDGADLDEDTTPADEGGADNSGDDEDGADVDRGESE